MILLTLVLLPALAGVLAWLLRRPEQQQPVLIGVAGLHALATACFWIWRPGPLGAYLALDSLGLLFLSITSALFLTCAFYSVGYLRGQLRAEPSALHRFVPLTLWFLAAMTLVCVTEHLALMWAAIEATTLASAPLIYFYKRRQALEAAWKYLLLCSVGIAIALLGTFFVGISASAVADTPTLELAQLTAAAPLLAPTWLKAAFVLALVGYGTKVGLAPMHNWLPDAYSQAPSPVAVLSGALLNCAFLGILRFYQVCVAAGMPGFAQTLLVTMGLVSLAVAAAFMVGQRDYKRLLAYSSVENMGIIAVGVGIGGAATFGALLHALNHSFAKAGLFFLAGNIMRTYRTGAAAEVRGVLRALPLTGVLLIAGTLAIGGAPPFGPFTSELTIFRWALQADPWVAGLFVVLLGIAFLGMAGVILPMAWSGGPAATEPEPEPVRESRLEVVPPLVLLGAVLVLGVWIPPFLSDLLRQAAGLLGGF